MIGSGHRSHGHELLNKALPGSTMVLIRGLATELENTSVASTGVAQHYALCPARGVFHNRYAHGRLHNDLLKFMGLASKPGELARRVQPV